MTIIVQTIASASSRDYDWLQSAIVKWSGNRADLAPLIPDFVMLAERRINADLDSRQQEALVSLPVASEALSVALPADAGRIRALSVGAVGELEYMTPSAFTSKQMQSTPGQPRAYTVIGSDVFLGPVPDADYSLQLSYWQYVPALADNAGTNWLITQHPEVYLAASMCESILYTKNVEALPMWEQKYAVALAGVNKQDSFTGANLRVRSDARNV